jgi:precorrin-2 methylase
MRIHIEIDEQELKRLVINRLEEIMADEINEKNVIILVKSKNNYKSEWEPAAFKAEYNSYK